eukprot:6190422-Pleurochrysis_carterae.AAC.1
MGYRTSPSSRAISIIVSPAACSRERSSGARGPARTTWWARTQSQGGAQPKCTPITSKLRTPHIALSDAKRFAKEESRLKGGRGAATPQTCRLASFSSVGVRHQLTWRRLRVWLLVGVRVASGPLEEQG